MFFIDNGIYSITRIFPIPFIIKDELFVIAGIKNLKSDRFIVICNSYFCPNLFSLYFLSPVCCKLEFHNHNSQ